MTDLYVELANPNAVYFPGNVVNGNVFIRLKEPMKARCVTASIMGKARTHWTCWEERSTTNRSTTSESVPYWSEIIYIDQHVCLWDSTAENKKLPAGEHRFPFSFILPLNIPPTYEAKIDRPWKFDKVCQRAFTVTPHFDLNTITYSGLPTVKQMSKDLGFLLFKSGHVNIKIMLAKTGYVPGESMALTMEVQNMSKKDINRVEVSLVQTALCSAQRRGHHHHFGTHFRYKDVETKEEIRTVVNYCENFVVNKHSTGNYQRMLAIPPVVSSFNICPIISVAYYLKVKVVAKGINNSITSELPVLLGTIPVRPNAVMAQSIEFPANIAPPMPSAPPPDYEASQVSYGNCMFGKSTMSDNQDEKSPDYTPNYIVINQ
ncbi:Arrestin-C domain-containing protein [Aphelenchoides bicaudatus]|nr:Arrestin-C domain-containing protein [Aphelenchoides bicaudatus]